MQSLDEGESIRPLGWLRSHARSDELLQTCTALVWQPANDSAQLKGLLRRRISRAHSLNKAYLRSLKLRLRGRSPVTSSHLQ